MGNMPSIREQILERMPHIRKRFGATKFLAYFQSYTNTYAPPDKLRAIYEEALQTPGIEGLCIGTRPDALPVDVLKLLEDLARTTYLSLELGVQSFENATLQFLERGHDQACAIQALHNLQRIAPHVHRSVHLIFGAPTDSDQAPESAAHTLNSCGVESVKLHQLMILKGTRLAQLYLKKPFPVLSIEEYADRAGRFLEQLNPNILVERLFATATDPEQCLAPEWSGHRWKPHNELRRLFQERGTVQGRLFIPSTQEGQ